MTNPVGRPPMFKTPEELQAKINDYFNIKCKDEIIKGDDDKPILNRKGGLFMKFNPPTVSGLALYLGFVNYKSMYDYEAKPKFTDIVKRAITRINEYAETQLFVGNSTGAIFWLKNRADWNDKHINENHNHEDVNVPNRQSRKEWEEEQRKKNEKQT